MDILVIAKLSPEKLLSKMRPFINNPKVEHIYLLRDDAFETSEKKISFLPLPHHKSVFRHLEKIKIAKRFSRNHNIDIILSYLLTPHGYMGWTISHITRKKWIHAIIAGHREIWADGKLMTKINLWLLKSASIISVMGKTTKEYLIKKGINKGKIAVIPNAIDSNIFKPSSQINKAKYDILYASRIDENKNFPLLIRAIEKVIKVFPNIKICVAGDGERLEEAKKECMEKGLFSNFLFLGHVSHNHIKDLYYQSKIFVLTSRGEGLPMALLEAMFCGLTCISTNVGEIGNIINDGENGFLLQDTEDDEVLASRIIQLMKDDILSNRISKKATELNRTYSFNNVTKLWDEALNNLL